MFRSWFIVVVTVKTLTFFSTTEKKFLNVLVTIQSLMTPKLWPGKNAKTVWFLMKWLISQNCGLPEVNTISV